MRNTPAMTRFKKARMSLLLDEPFFGTLLMQLKPVEDPSVPTFRTNGVSLWFNPAYMDQLTDPELRTVLAHEVLHPALLHPFRIGDREFKRANIAADYAVNNFLDQCNTAATNAGDPIPFPWKTEKDGQTHALLDHSYDNMSFEEIYSALGNKGDQPQQQPGAGQGQSPAASPPSHSPLPSLPSLPSVDNSPSSPGEFTQGPADRAEAQAAEANWKVALKQAATMAKAQGRLPAGIERLVTELLDPKLTWQEILRTLLTSCAKDDYTWTRPNARYSGGGKPNFGRLVLPSLWVPRMGKIAVAIDTSGSIGERELNEFLAEIRAILFDCKPEKLAILQCDAKVHEYLELDPFDEVDVQMKGGGGTDFRPVFERLDQELEPPAALVYLTDLYGDFPDNPPAYPVIWATINDETAPFGDTVHIRQ